MQTDKQAQHFLWPRAFCADQPAVLKHKMPDVPKVDIDEGTFKYILISATTATGEKVQLVRGHIGCAYHADVLEKVAPGLRASGLTGIECVGGGRIRRDASSINVYGYSQAFGQPDHAVTAELCRAHFPGLAVTWSNEGY